MNKIIKNSIEEADYNEVMDIMERANDRIRAIISEKENPWEQLFYIIKNVDDYKNRLHLELPPCEHCQYKNDNTIY